MPRSTSSSPPLDDPSLLRSTPRRVSYFYDPDVGGFAYPYQHPMKPHRMRMAHSLIGAYGMLGRMQVVRPKRANETDLTRFHTDEYIEFLKSITAENYMEWTANKKFCQTDDCPPWDGLWDFTTLTAGSSISAAHSLVTGHSDIAIAWAGGLHHAKRAEASGFCYVNDIVLGILELLRAHPRVLYIDIDIHHGDGVEEAFYTTDRVMTCSFHKFGDFFPGTGTVGDVGKGRGKGYAVNFPLRDGLSDERFVEAFKTVVGRIMEWYRPGAVVLQGGADSLAGDKLGVFNLSMHGHAACAAYIRTFNVPLLMVGGGGYTVKNVARTWTYETAVAIGCQSQISPDLPNNEYLEWFGPRYKLEVLRNNMEDYNTADYLDGLKQKIWENMRELPFAPGAQVNRQTVEVGEWKTWEGDEWSEDDSEMDDLDRRISQRLRDKHTRGAEDPLTDEEDAEEYDSDEDHVHAQATRTLRARKVPRKQKYSERFAAGSGRSESDEDSEEDDEERQPRYAPRKRPRKFFTASGPAGRVFVDPRLEEFVREEEERMRDEEELRERREREREELRRAVRESLEREGLLGYVDGGASALAASRRERSLSGQKALAREAEMDEARERREQEEQEERDEEELDEEADEDEGQRLKPKLHPSALAKAGKQEDDEEDEGDEEEDKQEHDDQEVDEDEEHDEQEDDEEAEAEVDEPEEDRDEEEDDKNEMADLDIEMDDEDEGHDDRDEPEEGEEDESMALAPSAVPGREDQDDDGSELSEEEEGEVVESRAGEQGGDDEDDEEGDEEAEAEVYIPEEEDDEEDGDGTGTVEGAEDQDEEAGDNDQADDHSQDAEDADVAAGVDETGQAEPDVDIDVEGEGEGADDSRLPSPEMGNRSSPAGAENDQPEPEEGEEGEGEESSEPSTVSLSRSPTGSPVGTGAQSRAELEEGEMEEGEVDEDEQRGRTTGTKDLRLEDLADVAGRRE